MQYGQIKRQLFMYRSIASVTGVCLVHVFVIAFSHLSRTGTVHGTVYESMCKSY